jgi:hypothetical protein
MLAPCAGAAAGGASGARRHHHGGASPAGACAARAGAAWGLLAARGWAAAGRAVHAGATGEHAGVRASAARLQPDATEASPMGGRYSLLFPLVGTLLLSRWLVRWLRPEKWHAKYAFTCNVMDVRLSRGNQEWPLEWQASGAAASKLRQECTGARGAAKTSSYI